MITQSVQEEVTQVQESSQVAEARRLAAAMALRLNFSETEIGNLSIVVTELGTNMVKHGGGGEVIIRPVGTDESNGIEVLALDKGPGMADLQKCLSDGYSTAGSPGTGMGAILRLSSQYDIYTWPGMGTAIMTRHWSGPPPSPSASELEIEALSIPMPRETVCGDSWSAARYEGRDVLLAVDGLGHGPLAATAAQEAVSVFQEEYDQGPVSLLRSMHGALRSTRGAAAAVAEIDLRNRTVRYAGVGNIASAVCTREKVHRMISHNGTLGHEAWKIQEFHYPWLEGAVLVMHSDGLGTQWNLNNYPGLLDRHPSIIAGVLYRDFSRRRDDTTIVVARESGAL